MTSRRVRWADEVASDAFVPPETPRSPPLLLPSTNDSVTDPSPPSTPQFTSRNDSRIYEGAGTYACERTRYDAPPPITWSDGSNTPRIVDPRCAANMNAPFIPPIQAYPPSDSSPRALQSPQIATPTLHRLLVYNPQLPAPYWDMCDEPTSTTVRSSFNGSPFPAELLYAPATKPPLREMHIQCIWQACWLPVTITATNSPARSSSPRSQSPETVTVLMVLQAIYRYLHRGVTAREFALFGSIPGEQTAISQAFYARCERHTRGIDQRVAAVASASAGLEKKAGLKRLDCLRGQTIFSGLCPLVNGTGDYILQCTAPR